MSGINCAGCGRFIGYADLERSRFIFEPDSHFGPEVSEWECPRCVARDSRHPPVGRRQLAGSVHGWRGDARSAAIAQTPSEAK